MTHSGKFHADDVFATAVILLYLNKNLDEVEVVRTRDEKQFGKADFLYDVGRDYDPSKMHFDHHQEGGAGKRQNDVPYASFGLVWKEFGAEVSGSEALAEKIDGKLVQPIDANDNGLAVGAPEDGAGFALSEYTIDNIIGVFNPTWDSYTEEEFNLQFIDAVKFAKKVLEREIKHAQKAEESALRLAEIYNKTEDKRLLVLDKPYFWKGVVEDWPEPLYIVFPYDGQWGLSAVREKGSKFKNRKDLPREWGGKEVLDLRKITGVEDVLFVHNNLFAAKAASKDGALKLAEIALEA